MEIATMDIREFCDKLTTRLLTLQSPVAVTHEGHGIGYFVPVSRKRSADERAALKDTSTRLQLALDAAGISEDEIVADFKLWRMAQK